MLARLHDDTPDAGPRKSAAGLERFCAATGEVRPVDEMIRFVVSPDGAVVADLKRRLPGRGIWITANRAALRKAMARKAFARAFKRDVTVPADLPETTERLLEKAALDTLAMAHKAGRVAIGFAKAEAALSGGHAVALLHASDAAPDGVRKLAAVQRRTSAAAHPAVALDELSSAQLDLALGRSNVIHAALLSGPETKAFLARAARLESFRTGRVGKERGGKPEEWNRNG